jgi:8-oxo-dGTP diphosphatase
MTATKIPTFGIPLDGVTYVERYGAYAFLLDRKKNLAVVETPNGFFLPGGGVEGKETLEQALQREVFEEIGLEVVRSKFIVESMQFHWSDFYQKHFKKIGSFYEIEVRDAPPARHQAAHRLHWLSGEKAEQQLSQEFQRWSLDYFLRHRKL